MGTLGAISVLLSTLIVASIALYLLSAHRKVTRDSFLVAEWSIPITVGAITLAATWTQAPALLFSGQQAHASVAHFVSFWVPNVAALVVAGLLVTRIRARLPQGYTIPQFMGSEYGPSVRFLTFCLSFATLVLIIGYTVTGMRLWLAPQLGLSAWQIAPILGIAAVLWVLPTGLPGAVNSDKLKIAVIGLGCVGVFVLWLTWYNSGFSSTPTRVSTTVPWGSWWTLWVVGVPLAASFIGGPITNCDLGERMYAMQQKTAQRAYLLAATLFGIIVLIYGSLGVLVRVAGIDTKGGLASLSAVQAINSPILSIMVTMGLALILAAALASFLASAGNLLTVEAIDRTGSGKGTTSIQSSRAAMLVPLALGTLIASQEQVDMGVLLRALAVVRGELIFPIIIAAFFPGLVPGVYVFWGMLSGLVVGSVVTYGPLLLKAYGVSSPFVDYHSTPVGALLAVFLPLASIGIGYVVHKGVPIAKHS